MSLKFSNTTSDFIEWDTMLNLVRNLFNDGNYQMSLLIALGSFWGLRISDLLNLTWSQILNTEQIEIHEKKTGKRREIKINSQLQKHIAECFNAIEPRKIESKCFLSQKGTVYSVQRINVILKELKAKYNIKIEHFSSHSLRKTFGRAVYNNSENNAEFALVKLSELFNHSDVRTTRKYLGLRNDELMETYELLKF
jgi:integrase